MKKLGTFVSGEIDLCCPRSVSSIFFLKLYLERTQSNIFWSRYTTEQKKKPVLEQRDYTEKKKKSTLVPLPSLHHIDVTNPTRSNVGRHQQLQEISLQEDAREHQVNVLGGNGLLKEYSVISKNKWKRHFVYEYQNISLVLHSHLNHVGIGEMELPHSLQ